MSKIKDIIKNTDPQKIKFLLAKVLLEIDTCLDPAVHRYRETSTNKDKSVADWINAEYGVSYSYYHDRIKLMISKLRKEETSIKNEIYAIMLLRKFLDVVIEKPVLLKIFAMKYRQERAPYAALLFLIAMTMADKVTEDIAIKNKCIARGGGIPFDEYNKLELDFCSILNFALHVTLDSIESNFALENKANVENTSNKVEKQLEDKNYIENRRASFEVIENSFEKIDNEFDRMYIEKNNPELPLAVKHRSFKNLFR